MAKIHETPVGGATEYTVNVNDSKEAAAKNRAELNKDWEKVREKAKNALVTFLVVGGIVTMLGFAGNSDYEEELKRQNRLSEQQQYSTSQTSPEYGTYAWDIANGQEKEKSYEERLQETIDAWEDEQRMKK